MKWQREVSCSTHWIQTFVSFGPLQNQELLVSYRPNKNPQPFLVVDSIWQQRIVRLGIRLGLIGIWEEYPTSFSKVWAVELEGQKIADKSDFLKAGGKEFDPVDHQYHNCDAMAERSCSTHRGLSIDTTHQVLSPFGSEKRDLLTATQNLDLVFFRFLPYMG